MKTNPIIFHGTRKHGRNEIEIDHRGRVGDRFGHPCLGLNFAFNWGPQAYLCDLRLLGDAILQEVCCAWLCAGKIPPRELDALAAAFGEDVIAELPDDWTLFDFECVEFVTAWLRNKALWK